MGSYSTAHSPLLVVPYFAGLRRGVLLNTVANNRAFGNAPSLSRTIAEHLLEWWEREDRMVNETWDEHASERDFYGDEIGD